MLTLCEKDHSFIEDFQICV